MKAFIDGGATFQDDLYVRDGERRGVTDETALSTGLSTGTLTAITDVANASAPVSQCYAYNGLNRLESAWTIAGGGSGCASDFAGNSTSLDASATKYATAWEYSTAGSITSVQNLLTDTSRAYTPDTVHPAAVGVDLEPRHPRDPCGSGGSPVGGEPRGRRRRSRPSRRLRWRRTRSRMTRWGAWSSGSRMRCTRPGGARCGGGCGTHADSDVGCVVESGEDRDGRRRDRLPL